MARLSYVMLIIAMNALMCVLAKEEPDPYDGIDVTAILQNDDLRKEYTQCYMEVASCKTPEQKALAEMFAESIRTKCKKCTQKQKDVMKLVTDWYIKNEPDVWQQILAKAKEDMKKKKR